MTRHFSFLRNSNETSKRFETLYNADRLRTFLPLSMAPGETSYVRWMSSASMQELFSKFKFLNVLSLSGYFNVIELPHTIGNLKHLRYLDLSGTNIKKLPDSLCFLYNLQILKLTYCRYLEELPLNLHQLTNLRYLDYSETKVRKLPMDMGKLKNLQVLSSFYVGKGSESNIKQLGELNLHGTLSISELQNIVNPLDALAANLKNKVHLMKLKLEWNANNDDSQQEREVLEKLQPSKHLKELSIRSYGGTLFPDWFGDNSLSNVVFLELSNCENCVLLPQLGIFPSLKELRITGLSGIVVIGCEFYGNGSRSSSVIPFASLETLKFKDMEGWEEWECKIATDAFPHLQKLSIENCPNLKEHLPEKLTCLLTLQISNCKQLVASIPWAPTIHELCLTNCGKLRFDYHPSTLKILEIAGCCMEASLLEWIGQTLPDLSLESLVIEDCPTMNIPLCRCYNFLVKLEITSSCDSLRTFPLDFFPKLESLKMRKCSNLEMISQEHEHGHSLTYLTITECPKFVSFPKGGFFAPRLKYFDIIQLDNLKSLPECTHILHPSLFQLTIYDCPQLESFPDGGLPSNLEFLLLKKCSKHLVASLKWALGTNSCLKYLYIAEVDAESFPNQGLLPLSLTSLSIGGCLNLKKLDYKGLYHLSLTQLLLYDCPSLECLPVEGLPKSISTLNIWGNCFLLKQRCKKPKGEDWGKISHIECVKIDDDIIT